MVVLHQLVFALLACSVSMATSTVSWTLQEEPDSLVDGDPVRTTHAGYCIDTAADVMAVGVPHGNVGIVHIYRLTGANWSLEASIEGDDPSFGMSVSVTPSGSSVLVGAPSINQATVFEHTGTSWINATSLVAKHSPIDGEMFGWAVASNQDWFAVSIPLEKTNQMNERGRVHLFSRQGEWVQDVISDTMVEGSRFGTAIAMTLDTMVVGAPYHDSARGAAIVYTLNTETSTWEEIAERLVVGGRPKDRLGHRVGLTTGLMAISALGTDDDCGAVHVYEGTAPFASLHTLEHDVAGDRFGMEVALQKTNDGSHLLVVGLERANSMRGRIKTYSSPDGTTWTEETTTDAEEVESTFGWAMALHGRTLVVGAPLARDHAGSVRIYQNSQETLAPTLSNMPSPAPSKRASSQPSLRGSQSPSYVRSSRPSPMPSQGPSPVPSNRQSESPTSSPTPLPSTSPSLAPSTSFAPTLAPTTAFPTLFPSSAPSDSPPCGLILRTCERDKDCCSGFCGGRGRCWIKFGRG